MHKKTTRSVMRLTLLGALLALLATQAVGKFTLDSVFDQLDLLVDVRHEIVEHFVEQPDEQKLVESAVRGMVDALGDRYTVFLSPDDLADFDKQVRGSFSGIGAEIDIHNDYLRIVTPLEGSPAFQSGVLPGDIVLEIEGESTKGIDINDAVSKLTGEAGTTVTILIRHESGQQQAITITRQRIVVPTIKSVRRTDDGGWDFMLDPERGIGYVRLSQFTDATADDLRQVVTDLKQRGMKALILDVRFNPGGLLPAAIGVSDLFLKAGQRIVSIKGRTVPEQVYQATDDTLLPDAPVIVLANDASASASEIVAGALTDNQRAVMLGTRTFGKGSVQQVRMLESGHGAIKITNAYYYLPNGRKIHRVDRDGDDEGDPDQTTWGVDPNEGFYVEMTPEQLRLMFEKRRDLLLHPEAYRDLPATPEAIEERLADPQLAAALKAVSLRLETGQWQPVGLSGVAELAALRDRGRLRLQRDQLTERIALIDKLIEQAEHGQALPDADDRAASRERYFKAQAAVLADQVQSLLDVYVDDDVEQPEEGRLKEIQSYLLTLEPPPSTELLPAEEPVEPGEAQNP